MLVMNKTQHVIATPLFEQGSAIARDVVLRPGVNVVSPDADWERVKAHLTIQYRITAGELIEQDSVPLAKRPEKQAMLLIKDTFDPELLKAWREDDQRPDVRKAIDAQIRECTLSEYDKQKLKGE